MITTKMYTFRNFISVVKPIKVQLIQNTNKCNTRSLKKKKEIGEMWGPTS